MLLGLAQGTLMSTVVTLDGPLGRGDLGTQLRALLNLRVFPVIWAGRLGLGLSDADLRLVHGRLEGFGSLGELMRVAIEILSFLGGFSIQKVFGLLAHLLDDFLVVSLSQRQFH